MTVIRTPDYRLRVFISSTLQELAPERAAVRAAVTRLRLTPIMFEAGARPHPPRELYRSYLEQSHVFVGIYWQRYGWVAPGEDVSGLEDEYLLSGDRPKLIYVKGPAPEREPRLTELLHRVQADDKVSYRPFSSVEELGELVENDLAILLSERYDLARRAEPEPEHLEVRGAPPRVPTLLVGRSDEVATVTELMRRPDVRLLTLSGPGGIGKSRIALAATEKLAGDFADGLCWVGLATIRQPNLVESAFAHTLNLRESAGRSPLDSVVAHLRGREVLLVADNFEQVLPAAPVISRVLAECPRVKVLVSSRALLHVRGEREFVVPPLPVEAEAVELFVSRARAVNPQLTLSEADLHDVAEICRRLDGLPLAIELAAARTRLLSPAALLTRLRHRLAVLTAGPRDLPERQQTLRATLDWDYDLLDPDEQALLRRLGAATDGCTLESAEVLAQAGGPLGTSVLDCVDSLIGKSLLRQVVGPNGEPRFAMLQTVREYALERLTEAGEESAVLCAHAEYFADLAEDVAGRLRGPDSARLCDQLDAEHPNLRAAIDWAAEAGDVDLELRLVAALGPFWERRGHLRQAARRASSVLGRSTGHRSAWRAQILLMAARLARAREDLSPVAAMLAEARSIFEELGDLENVAVTIKDYGLYLYDDRRVPDAIASWEDALARFRALGDDLGVSMCLNNLAVGARISGQPATAARRFAECLEIQRRLHDEVGVARALMNLGTTANDLGEPAVAAALFRHSLRHWAALGDVWNVTDIFEGVAIAAANAGDRMSAARLLGATATLRDRIGAVRPAVEQREIDVLLEALRAALGAGFESAFDAGAAQPYDESVAEADRVAGRLSGGPTDEAEAVRRALARASVPTPRSLDTTTADADADAVTP